MFVFLYLIACWTVIIDIVCFILFAVCMFICFYCSLFMSVLLLNACVCHVLIKGNLLTYLLTYLQWSLPIALIVWGLWPP